MTYQDLLKIIDKVDTAFSHAELQDMFRSMLNEFEDESLESVISNEEYKNVRFEWDALRLSAQPMFYRGGNREHRFLIKYGAYPIEEGYYTNEHLSYYRSRIVHCHNPFLLSRYYDLLWEYKKRVTDLTPVDIANAASDNYLNCAVALIDVPKQSLNFISLLDRSFEFAVTVKNEDKIQECFKVLKEAVASFSKKRELTADCIRLFDRLLILSQIFRNVFKHSNVECLPPEYHQELFNVLESVKNFLLKSKVYDAQRYFLGEMIILGRIIGYSEARIKEMNLEIGSSYEAQAQNQPGGPKHLAAASWYENAHKHYVSIGERDKAEEMKNKIREENKAAKASGEYATISTPVEFSIDELDQAATPYLRQETINDSLRVFWIDQNFNIDIKKFEDGVREANKCSPLLFLLNKSLSDDYNSSYFLEGLDEKFYYAVNTDISMKITLMTIPLSYILEKLKEKKGLNAETMCAFFREWKHMNERHMEMIEVAVNRYFAQDYISATCILATRLESILRDFFEEAGIPVTSMKKRKQQYQYFGDFLSSEKVKNGLGEGFLRFLQVLLVDIPGGINLRNRVAHGYIHGEECSKELVEILLLTLIKITHYILKKEDINSNKR